MKIMIKNIKMKLTNKELKKIVESVINNLSEDNFQLDLEDPNMPQKLNKLKNDITLFNKNEDSIEIKSDEDELSEQISFTKKELFTKLTEKIYNGKLYTKSEINEIINKNK